MSTAPQLYRFGCPHCSRVLKASVDWAGRRGICPSCQNTITFPTTSLTPTTSWTAQQLLKVVSDEDKFIDEPTLDRIAMLIAQGTCLEFAMAAQALPGGQLSAGQWRRLLTLAATREALRLQIISHLDSPLLDDDDLTGEPAFAMPPEHPQDAATESWHIMTRYLHHQRHATCNACKANPTGMHCIYQTFDTFLAATAWPVDRQSKWERVCRHTLGLDPSSSIPLTSAP